MKREQFHEGWRTLWLVIVGAIACLLLLLKFWRPAQTPPNIAVLPK